MKTIFHRTAFLVLTGMLLFLKQAAAQDCTTNILIAYSDNAADSLGGDEDIVDAIMDAVYAMNTIYIYSDVNQQTTLVRTVRLNENETDCFVEDLNAFQGSTYIDSLRTKYHADIAVVILGNNEFCGLPYLDDTVANVSTAYCAVNFYCMVNNFALSHQVAHLYGCSHSSSTPSEENNAPYSYGHGYNFYYDDGESFSTIMGVADDDFCYGDDEDACNLIPYFSNPTLLYDGIVLGVEDLNDNARVLNENTSLIGSFKPVPATQSSLSDTVDLYNIALAYATDTLGTGSYYIIEDAATVTFQSGQQIVLNPGFSAAEGVYFETIIGEPEDPCGE